jgi:drug/metabolite transporter (DMT)-like permease
MLRTRRPVVQTARGLLLVLSTIFVVLALRVMPLAQTYAIGFSTPLIATVVAAIALGERAAGDWALLAVGGAFGTLGHLLLIEAFRRAPTAVVSSMLYTQIVTASSLGYLVFGDVPGIPTLLGAAIVAASGFAIVRSRF